MNEKIPAAVSGIEQGVSPAQKLFDYLSSLPKQGGELPIQGQVQIRIEATDNDEAIYQDSALYGLTFDGKTLSFKAANTEGRLVTYTSIEGSSDKFTDEEGIECLVRFPGFLK